MKSDISSDFELNVSPEFITEGIKNAYRQHKKSGPYTKDEKMKRQNEVYRFHFEYGYSARKIAEMMKVNRNTINSDIEYWYGNISEKAETLDLESTIIKRVEGLEIQRTRLREMLDKTEDFQQKITIEKLLFDIEIRIAQINLKILESSDAALGIAIHYINKWMKENNHEDEIVSYRDTLEDQRDWKKIIDKNIWKYDYAVFSKLNSDRNSLFENKARVDHG